MLTNFWRPLFWLSLTASLVMLLAPAETVLQIKVWLASWLPFGKQLDQLDATQHSDKWIHFAVFGLLGWLGSQAWRLKSKARHRLLIGLLFMAVGTECIQHWVPGRSASLGDLLADLAGLTLGLLVSRVGASRTSYKNALQNS